MTRAEKVARAQALRARGLKWQEVADEMGCALNTAKRYFHDPDGVRAHAENVRAGRRREQKARYDYKPCPRCGSPRAYDATLCLSCANADKHTAQETRHRTIERLWREGATLREIAAALESTPASVGVSMVRMRQAGHYDLPYRGTPRVAA